MDQEKFGKFIKEIRKQNNLTQKQLADKYNVTYQAVSKWENGKNLPDKTLILEMSRDFGISIEELFIGESLPEKKEKKYSLRAILSLLILVVLGGFIIFHLNRDKNFEFKTLTSSCNDFNISGTVAYNDKKSAIYITNIEYCGGEETEEYREIECILYETDRSVEKKISSYKYEKKEPIKLEDFLKEVTFTIDNYDNLCKEYEDESLFLIINAQKENAQTISYKVPLRPNKCS